MKIVFLILTVWDGGVKPCDAKLSETLSIDKYLKVYI